MHQIVGGDRAIVLDEDAELAGLVGRDDATAARHASRAEVMSCRSASGRLRRVTATTAS